jgi:ribosomal protein S18 acetylase RimI-like enzyme
VGKSNLIYKIGTGTENDIYLHLTECSNDFTPPLAKKVNIIDYSKKIKENAITFEAWEGGKLIGLIAIYFNDKENGSAYITSVSTMNSFRGLGVATELLNRCVAYAKQKNYKEVKLEVNKHNIPAISFYKKFNFIIINSKADSFIMQLETKN